MPQGTTPRHGSTYSHGMARRVPAGILRPAAVFGEGKGKTNTPPPVQPSGCGGGRHGASPGPGEEVRWKGTPIALQGRRRTCRRPWLKRLSPVACPMTRARRERGRADAPPPSRRLREAAGLLPARPTCSASPNQVATQHQSHRSTSAPGCCCAADRRPRATGARGATASRSGRWTGAWSVTCRPMTPMPSRNSWTPACSPRRACRPSCRRSGGNACNWRSKSSEWRAKRDRRDRPWRVPPHVAAPEQLSRAARAARTPRTAADGAPAPPRGDVDARAIAAPDLGGAPRAAPGGGGRRDPRPVRWVRRWGTWAGGEKSGRCVRPIRTLRRCPGAGSLHPGATPRALRGAERFPCAARGGGGNSSAAAAFP